MPRASEPTDARGSGAATAAVPPSQLEDLADETDGHSAPPVAARPARRKRPRRRRPSLAYAFRAAFRPLTGDVPSGTSETLIDRALCQPTRHGSC